MAEILAEIAQEMEDKISGALEIAARYGTIDGGHHKMWVIDQMVRVLTGCEEVEDTAIDCRGNPYTYMTLFPSSDYRDFVQKLADDDDDWEVGIAP